MTLAEDSRDEPSGAVLRVAVAEDGGLFRAGLTMLLQARGHTVTGAVADGDQMLELLATHPVDVAILDIRMPPEPDGGLSTAQEIRRRHPGTGILLLSHYAEAHYLMKILQIGTERIGYRLKDRITNLEALHDTLTRITAGEIVIDPDVAGRLVAQPARQNDELASLSERERTVLELMAQGRSNAGIAEQLYVSVKVVEKSAARIFAKLDLPAETGSLNRRVLAVLAYLQARRGEG